MTEKTMIQFENVSKVYGEKTVVQPLDVSIQKGEFITILGTSGSGKTTLLKMINKLIEPTTGKVFFDGGFAPSNWLRCLADWPFSSHDCCGQHCDCA